MRTFILLDLFFNYSTMYSQPQSAHKLHTAITKGAKYRSLLVSYVFSADFLEVVLCSHNYLLCSIHSGLNRFYPTWQFRLCNSGFLSLDKLEKS